MKAVFTLVVVLGVVCAEASPLQVLKGCRTPCNNLVPHGYNGKGDGIQHCNTCRCFDGDYICTRKMCEPQSPKCLAEGDVCYRAGVEVGAPVDRKEECPMGTKCVANDGFAIGGEVAWTCKAPRSKPKPVKAKKPVKAEKPEKICCFAEPFCPEGTTQDLKNECKFYHFWNKSCVFSSMCCKTIVCKKSS